MMTRDTNTWRGDYRRLMDRMVGADPLIGHATIAERLAISEDDLDLFLGLDWLDLAASAQTK